MLSWTLVRVTDFLDLCINLAFLAILRGKLAGVDPLLCDCEEPVHGDAMLIF
jgi:hypothetical protein